MNFGDLFDESAASASVPAARTGRADTTRALINVQKSIQLLDDAVGSPSTLLRTRTPRHGGRLDNTSLSVMGRSTRSGLDQSSFMPPVTPRLGQSTLLQNMTGDASLYALATPGKSMVSGLEHSLNTTNLNTLLHEDPGIVASTGLFRDFLACIKARPSEHQVFDLLRDYEQACADQTRLLRTMVKMTTPGKTKFSNAAHMLRELEKERWTWTLIKSLFQDRVEHLLQQDADEDMMVDEQLGKYKSDKTLVDELYEKDANTRQAQIVVDWLERIAEEGFEDYRDQVEFFQDRSGAWENSLHTLKQRANNLPTQSQRQIVTELDPDAPLRQQRPLDDLDQADENRLLQFLFALVRSGQLDEAQRLCTRCGQSWRAATLEGWRLYHDPNYEQLGADGEIRPVEGNAYRDLWKSICWKMAQDDRLNVHERALYASLSGNLKPLLAVCRTWEDSIWAYYKVMVDQRVEQHVRLNTRCNRALHALPTDINSKTYDDESVFAEIEASSQEVISGQSRDPYNQIIKYVILNDIQELTKKMHSWTSSQSSPPSPHFQRFLAHLVLFFRSIDIETGADLSLEIVEAYVRVLIELRQNDLVASYVAALSQPLQVQWYAHFLEGITDRTERQQCLTLAEEAGLDLPQITRAVVENIRNKRSETQADNVLEATTTPEDRVKIEAIDWLVFDPAQRAEAVRQANAVMRAFLAVKKLSAAREVFLKLPHGSIEQVHQNWQMQAGSSELPPEDANAIHEFLCIQAYLDAHDSFNDWFHHYHNTRPPRPDFPKTATFTERVAQEHKMKQYNVDLERWQHSLEIQTKTTVERMYNVLLFVDGGWMVDIHQMSDSDSCRQQQMEDLRRLCLPQLCYLLVRVQTDSGQHSQCLQLVDVIAAESHKLYQVFDADELQKLLSMFKDSAVALLDAGKDPLGYEFSS